MGKIISIANRKGGVGKTTANIFVATALSQEGHSVVLLDCDSQASATKYRQLEKLDYGESKDEPYQIVQIDQENIFDEIRKYENKFDFVLIDIPRFTHGQGDSSLVATLALCSKVIVPTKTGDLDAISTGEFVEMLNKIKVLKTKENLPFDYAVFLSLSGRRTSDDNNTRNFLKQNGVKVFTNELKDLRIFSAPFTYESLLNVGQEEKERFEPFYKEVIAFIEN